MPWSIDSVLHAVLKSPEKALKKLDPADLDDLPALLGDAHRGRPDLDEGQRILFLACLTARAQHLPADLVAWAFTGRPRLDEPLRVRCLEALTDEQRVAVVAAMPDERRWVLANTPADGRRALVCADLEAWPFEALVFALAGQPDADGLLWDRRETLDLHWSGRADFVLGLRTARAEWLDIDRIRQRMVEVVDGEGWTRFEEAFGTRDVLLDRIERRIEGADDWEAGWLERVAPERGRRLVERLLGAPPEEPPLDTAWTASAFPGGLPTHRAAFEAWFGDEGAVSTSDLNGWGYVTLANGDRAEIALDVVPWGLVPAKGPSPWGGEQEWAALATAHALASELARRTNDAGLGPPSDGDVEWQKAVLRTDAGPAEAIEALFGLPAGQARVTSFHRREAFDDGGDIGRAIERLLAERSRGPVHVEVDVETVGTSPEFVLGRVGPYLAGIFCVRVWT